MIHSIPSTDTIAAPWTSTGRWSDALRQSATTVVNGVLRLCGAAGATPELWMSRDWLDEYDRRSRKHPDLD